MNYKLVLLILVLLLVIYLGYEYVRVSSLIKTSKKLVGEAKAFTAPASAGKPSMLVIGDSTAVGVGAETPSASTAGRVSRLLGDASVENYAKSGAVVQDIAQQILQAQKDKYDLVLIQGGANDVVQLKNLDETVKTMDQILKSAHQKSDHVILLTAGKIWAAPLLPAITHWYYEHRTLTLRTRFMQLSQQDSAAYVDLIPASQPFEDDPAKYYAADTFHPSGDGYGIWFEYIQNVIKTHWPELINEQ